MDLGTGIIIIGLLAVGFFLWKLSEQLKKPQDDQAMVMLQKQLFEIQSNLKTQDKSLNDQLGKSRDVINESLQKQFAATSKMVKDMMDSSRSVTEQLTKLGETNKQVVGFAKQMKSLENILKNPKQRGILGEFFLENLLSNQLPPAHFKMQYAFKNGEVVDAAIFIKGNVIPVDAKFSLENYNRMMEETNETERQKMEKEFKSDLKKRIDETSKYVRPDEGTTEFAFMFIPADGVFYNLLSYKVGTLDVNTHDLIEYAFRKHVIMVSPMTFYAYLQTVMHALKALKIEESAKEIQKRVGDLGRHLNAYQDHMNKVGSHLSTTVNAFNNAGNEYGKIDKDVIKITEGEVSIKAEIPAVERPKSFEESGSSVKVTIQESKKEQASLPES